MKRKRWYLDTEFHEDGTTIDLISIALVSETGEEYYAVSMEFDSVRCSDWVKQNVLSKLPYGDPRPWRTREQMRQDIRGLLVTPIRNGPNLGEPEPIELWAYFSAYDHVALAQLWGPMIELPKGIPMCTFDIRQEMSRLGVRRDHLPTQDNEHVALDDARWVRDAHAWLQRYEANRDH